MNRLFDYPSSRTNSSSPVISPKGARFDSPGRSPGFRELSKLQRGDSLTGELTRNLHKLSRPLGLSFLFAVNPGLRPGLSNRARPDGADAMSVFLCIV